MTTDFLKALDGLIRQTLAEKGGPTSPAKFSEVQGPGRKTPQPPQHINSSVCLFHSRKATQVLVQKVRNGSSGTALTKMDASPQLQLLRRVMLTLDGFYR